jgi:inner membrane protein
LIGANLPDVDALSYFAGADTGFALRRGPTHGILAIVLWPFVLTAILWAINRNVRLRPLFLISALAVLTHPFLDWLNTYGIRLLAPFDERWFYGDAAFIIEPWLWLALGGSVMLARKDRWPAPWLWAALGLGAAALVLGSEMVSPAAKAVWLVGFSALVVLRFAIQRPLERFARWGVGLAAAYIALLVSLSAAGKALTLRELERSGLGPVEAVLVSPRPADPFHWHVLVQQGGAYRHGTLSWLEHPRLHLADRVIPIAPADTAAVDAARGAPCIAGTLHWMRFPFAEIEPSQGGVTVRFIDARYAREGSRGFGTATVELDSSLRPRDCR